MKQEKGEPRRKGVGETEGARRATGVSPNGGAPVLGALAPGQRWSVVRKREVVLRLLRGESLEALSRELAVEMQRLQRWRDRALAGIDESLREREGDLLQGELDAAVKRVGLTDTPMPGPICRTCAERRTGTLADKGRVAAISAKNSSPRPALWNTCF